MTISNTVRWILIGSAIIFVLVAIICFTVIMFKIQKKRKEIMEDQIKITKEISNKESEKRMIEREDFGQPIFELQELLKKTINHEIVEFCINSCVRNNYKNILLVGNVEPYEVIAISNKANTNIIVKENEFDVKTYNKIKSEKNIVSHNLLIVNDLNENNKFDSIMVLNSIDNFDKLFLNNEKYLKEKGMFIFANTKANKKNVKALTKEIEKFNYRFEVLNWYTGFVTIVK